MGHIFYLVGMNKRIVRLAIPNIISNITIPLLGIVDTALMGHMDNLIYVGAIALGSMIFNFIYWGMGFLRMGTLGFTGQAYGAKDNNQISMVLYRSITISLIIAFLLLLLHPLVIKFGLSLTDSGILIKNEAANYFKVRIWALPASLMILSLSGWFIGMQNTIYPMIVSILSNVLNISISIFLVFNFGMKSEGVALGTVIAQYIALLIALILFKRKYSMYLISYKIKEVLSSKIKTFLNVNKDIFIRSLGIIFVLSFFTVKSANISDTVLAVNTILFQFFLFFSYLQDGFANAAEALSSEAIGAKNIVRLKLVVRRTLSFGFWISIGFTIIYYFFGDVFLKIMTDNDIIINRANDMIIWVILMPVLSFAAFILDGIYVGATASKAMRNAMLLSTLGIFAPIMYFGIGDELTKLWTAFLIFMLFRGLFLVFMLKKSVYIKINP